MLFIIYLVSLVVTRSIGLPYPTISYLKGESVQMFLSAYHIPDALVGSRCRIAQSKVGKTGIYKIIQYAKYCNSSVYSGRRKEENMK